MIIWQTGTVAAIVSERHGLQELKVIADDGTAIQAIHYTDVCEPIRTGERVRLNVTADTLRLGSGGHSFVYSVAGRGEAKPIQAEPQLKRDHDGHIMKLRYTPQQRAVLSVEEPASPHHRLFVEPQTLEGMPVLIGELHSMVPIVCAWLMGGASRTGAKRSALRLAYIMTDGAALPIVYSNHVERLKQLGWLSGTVTYGHAYGGDLEAVNQYTALLAARHVHQADLAIAAMGPGIAGTGTVYGHTATEMAELIHAVVALGGTPVVIPRISFADPRMRHQGISHHLLATLGKLTLAQAIIPLPAALTGQQQELVFSQLASSGCDSRHKIVWVDEVTESEVERRLLAYGRPITTMGRQLRDDPAFFVSASAAAQAVASVVRRPAQR